MYCLLKFNNSLVITKNNFFYRFSMYDMKSETIQEQQNKRRSLPSQLTIIPNITPIVSNIIIQPIIKDQFLDKCIGFTIICTYFYTPIKVVLFHFSKFNKMLIA